MILPFCSQHSRGGGWEATAPVTDGGPGENFGDGMSYLTALLSNLVWKGSRNVVSYSLYTEREKNSGKQGPPRRGGAAQGHGRWTVCFRSGSATTHGNPASSCGCCWSGRWRGGPRRRGCWSSPPEMRCWAGWTGMRGSWIWCSWTSRWRGPTAWIRPGPCGRQTRASSWYLSQGTVTMCLTAMRWEPWDTCSSPPGRRNWRRSSPER